MNPQTSEKSLDTGLASLLENGESLLLQDIDKDLEMLEQDPFTLRVDTEKYEKARAVFEYVLSIDPDNERAKQGLDACDDMLDVYIPVQYMMPPDHLDLTAALQETVDDAGVKSDDMDNDAPLPWDLRRRKLQEMRARDRAGMQFTGQVFSQESETAKKEVHQILETARYAVENGGDPLEICLETEKVLTDFQDKLNRMWKGHGPEILKTAKEELRDVLGIENKVDISDLR
jgi:hypothetical protein